MFDMNSINKRYWDVTIRYDTKSGEKEIVLNVECPKLAVLRKITELTKDQDNLISNLSEALSMAFSKNKQNKAISADFIEDNFDIDDINNLLLSYFNWVKDVKQSPN